MAIVLTLRRDIQRPLSFKELDDNFGIIQDIINSNLPVGTSNTNTITMNNTNGVLSSDLVISNQPNNAAAALPDGLYVPNYIYNGLIYGGVVTWAFGYTYEVSAAGYYINGAFYTTPAYTVAAGNAITLDAPDGTFNRIDVFYLDESSTVKILKGIPSSNPSKPSISVENIELSFVLVETGTTQPSIYQEQIYLENAGEPNEWSTSTNAPSRIVVGSTTSPIQGLKSINSTNSIKNDYVTFINDNIITPNDLSVLTFKLKPKAITGGINDKKLTINFYLGATQVSSSVVISNGAYNFAVDSQSIQTISIPLLNFNLTNNFDRIIITNTSTSNNTTFGFFLDDVKLQNVNTPVVVSGSQWIDVEGGIYYPDGYVGINKVGTPAEALDVNGNVQFNGALMPSGEAGLPGQVLISNGPDNAPEWADYVSATGSTGNGNVIHWLDDQNITLQPPDTIVISGDYVLRNTTITLLGTSTVITAGPLVFKRIAQIFVGGNLVLDNSYIINDGQVSVGGGIILLGNSDITGSGFIN